MKNVTFLTNNGVDVQKSLEYLGNMEVYEETLKDFLEGIDAKLQNLNHYKEIGDMANYAVFAHSIKSDARYLGFTTLGEIAYNHEMEGKAGNLHYITLHYDALVNEVKHFVEIVKKYLEEPSEKTEKIKEQPTSLDKKILVVDDSDLMLKFVQKIFDGTYQVIMAKDGADAIEKIKQTPTIAAMLLDLNMPNVNGFAVLEYFKQNDLFKKIPVSIISGADEKEVIDKAFTYDIVDLLVKPFNERDIKSVIEKTINYKNM